MKLITFTAEGHTRFGCVVGTYACSFHVLERLENDPLDSSLDSAYDYLAGLPASHDYAVALARKAGKLFEVGQTEEFHRLDEVKIEAPLQPWALIDFGLTPTHLVSATRTLLRHEFGPVLGPLAAFFLAWGIRRSARSPILPYYKGNHLTIIGDDELMGWPAYTSYLDIEPELAFVTGPGGIIGGYVILNDVSARDVQLPEMIGGGPSRSKDFDRGNGIGPFLVTPDEIPDPLNLAVTVQIGERLTWHGHTGEIRVHPTEVAAYLQRVFPLAPGMVIGLGTIPGCTGLDHNDWILPGEAIAMTIEGLGTLRQHVPAAPNPREKSRWKERKLS